MEQTMIEIASGFISEQMLVLIPVLWVIGAVLKYNKNLPDWAIVYILPVIAVILAFLVVGITVEAFIQGILVAGVAVFGHQLVKQVKKK